MIHGNFSGCADDLPDAAVLQIVRVWQDSTVYAADSDYVRSGDKVDWAPGGQEPATGSTYQVTYDYLNTDIEPKNPDYDGFTVENAVPGSSIMITYRQALPRVDRLCLNSDGIFSVITGVARESGARKPETPSGQLALASVYQAWRGQAPAIENDGVRVVPFSSIMALDSRIDYCLSEVARTRLEMDLATREAGQRAGMLVDPFLDDTVRDQGLDQTAAIVGGALMLGIDATPLSVSADIRRPVSAASTLAVALEQALSTGEMKVNPYMAFAVSEGRAELSPSVDRWTETDVKWASPVTNIFATTTNVVRRVMREEAATPGVTGNGSLVWGGVWGDNSRTDRTSETVTTKVEDEYEAFKQVSQIRYLRQIRVDFELSGFGAGDYLESVNFGGFPAIIGGGRTIDSQGELRGWFTIPAKVPAGIKQVEFRARSNVAYATFTGEGKLEAHTLRKVQNIYQHTTNTTTITTTRYNYVDPLAQTFSFEKDCMLAGVDLWFKTRGTTNAKIQLRETQTGMPTAIVLAEAMLTPAQEKTDGATRVLFDAPVPVLAGVEYAIVILCNDPQTGLAIAEIGQYDKSSGKWVTAQPYTVGTLLSSSNASTWTAHQNADLAFRLLTARYAKKETVIELGHVALPAGTTDIILQGLAELPASSCRFDYEIELPDGQGTLTLAAGQGVSLATAVGGQARVTARLYGDASASPVLWPGTQIIAGKLRTSGTYATRSVVARDARRVIVVYDAWLPAGSSLKAEIRLDEGAWTTLANPVTSQQGDGVVEYKFEQAISNVDLVKLRLTLSGTPKARPQVGNLRLMTVV